LKNFVLPSGGKLSAHLHVCRSVTRRFERAMQPLARQNDIDASAAIYVNRLSDYFFVAARLACQVDCETETIYKPGTALQKEQDVKPE
jgi:cob(I)alamin adenosyltransferase